jgi:hypothetical protein
MSTYMGVVITSKLATLHELQTVYSLEDMFSLLDVLETNNHNTYLMDKARR